ncbi:MAG: XdhC family protein [Thainema sp.]
MSIQLFQRLHHQLQQGDVVMATVISATGSVPREVGAKMLIWANGETAGTIGGGAGEAKVIQAARETLQTGHPQRVEIDLSGATHRLTQGVCGGCMQVWLGLWSGSMAVNRVREIITVLSDTSQSLLPYLVTPLVEWVGATAPSTHPKQALPYLVNHQVLSQVSDFDDRQLANQPAIATVPLTIPSPISDSTPTISAFIEPLRPDPMLLIVGAGHVGIALAQAAHFAGFRIAIQDERPEWATPDRLPPNTQILPGAIAPALAHFSLSPNNYVALVTRGYSYDVAALTSLLTHHAQLPVRYLGMIGSRKRSQMVLQSLREKGITESVIRAIHAPIGLDIGALTPEEIAISIVAELIQIRRRSG